MNPIDKVILAVGHTLKRTGSRQTGFMGNIDVDEYNVLSPEGELTGKVTITTHMEVKAPNRQSARIQQYSADGKLLQDVHVNPDA